MRGDPEPRCRRESAERSPGQHGTAASTRAIHRRGFLGLLGAGVVSVAGCLQPPASSPPRYETREIDDGALYGPGLALGPSMEVFADLVTSDAQARAFDLQAVPRDADRAFIEATDYRTAYLGVVQVSGLNSSMSVQLVDIAVSADQLVLAFDVEDTPPHSDDWVITSILVRVKRERRLPSAARESSPDGIRVRLSIGDRTMTACGGC